jgi:hypothetical protein
MILLSYGYGVALASVLSVQYVQVPHCISSLPGQERGNEREKDNQKTGKREEKETRDQKKRGKRGRPKNKTNREIVNRRCQALPEAPQHAHRQKEKQNNRRRRGKNFNDLLPATKDVLLRSRGMRHPESLG